MALIGNFIASFQLLRLAGVKGAKGSPYRQPPCGQLLQCVLGEHLGAPRLGAPALRELAEIFTMGRSALGQTLRPLERDGLLELGRDERDARRQPVRLTRPGHEALARAWPYRAEAHRRFTAFFGDQALTELRATLRGIAEDSRLAFFSFAKEPTHDEP